MSPAYAQIIFILHRFSAQTKTTTNDGDHVGGYDDMRALYCHIAFIEIKHTKQQQQQQQRQTASTTPRHQHSATHTT
jgi:hypothetical protein